MNNIEIELLKGILIYGQDNPDIIQSINHNYFSLFPAKVIIYSIKKYLKEYQKFPTYGELKIFIHEHEDKIDFSKDQEKRKLEWEKIEYFLKIIKNKEEYKKELFSEEYFKKQLSKFIKRKIIIQNIDKLKNAIQSGENLEETLEHIKEKIEPVSFEEDDGFTINNFLYLNKPVRIEPCPTGLETVDYWTDGGLARGELGMIASPSGCVDKDTEFLTPNGWKKISEYKPGDLICQWYPDGTTEFIKPLKYIKKPAHIFYHIKSKTFEMVISKDHRVPYFTPRKKGIRVDQIENILKRFSQPHSYFNIPREFSIPRNNPGLPISDELLRVFIMQCADGHILPNCKRRFRVRLRFKKERKKKRAIELLEKAGIPYKIHDSKSKYNKGYLIISYYAPKEIATKDMTMLYQCNEHQAKVVVEEILFWDGSIYQSKNGSGKLRTVRAFTGKKEYVDVFQFLASGVYRSTVSLQKDKRKYVKYDIWEARINNKKTTTIVPRKHVRKKILKGEYQYCFTVPSSFWLARKNGYIFPTGNSGKSTFLCNLAFNACLIGKPVIYITLEMSEAQILQKLISLYTNIPAKEFKNKKPIEVIEKHNIDLKELKDIFQNVYIKFFAADTNIFEIAKYIARMKKIKNIDAIFFIDYLNEISFPQAKEIWSQMQKIMTIFDKLAVQLEVPIWIATQAGDKAKNKVKFEMRDLYGAKTGIVKKLSFGLGMTQKNQQDADKTFLSFFKNRLYGDLRIKPIELEYDPQNGRISEANIEINFPSHNDESINLNKQDKTIGIKDLLE